MFAQDSTSLTDKVRSVATESTLSVTVSFSKKLLEDNSGPLKALFLIIDFPTNQRQTPNIIRAFPWEVLGLGVDGFLSLELF